MFNLTRQEKLVLIFIGITSLIGVGANFCQKSRNSLAIYKIIEEQKLHLRVNLNRASLQDLARISLIGPTLARAIIDFRSRHGNFESLEELKLVKGISQSRFNQIKTSLTLD